MIVSGSIFEYYRYGKLINSEGKAGSGRKKKNENKHRTITLNRARKEIRRMINTNINQWNNGDEAIISKFLTLTFRDNIEDISWANREFSKFIMRLNYEVGWKIKYITVIEFQSRGAIHYHSVLFNMPFIPVEKIQNVWGHGFVKINSIEKVDNVGAYVTKYMSADFADERLLGKKMYFKSRGLLEPYETIDCVEIESYLSMFDDTQKVYEKDFEVDFVGDIHYEQFNTGKCISYGLAREMI